MNPSSMVLPPWIGNLPGQCSGKFRLGVSPGLDGREDGIITVGRYPDLVAAEGHVVDLPACIVALERRRESVLFGNVYGIATHSGRECGVCEDGSHCGVECSHGRCPGGGIADNLGFHVLELDPCGISFTALAHRVLGDAADIVGSAAPRVAGDDSGDQGVEGRDVCNRRSQFADCSLRNALLNKISHFLLAPALYRAVSR